MRFWPGPFRNSVWPGGTDASPDQEPRHAGWQDDGSTAAGLLVLVVVQSQGIWLGRLQEREEREGQ